MPRLGASYIYDMKCMQSSNNCVIGCCFIYRPVIMVLLLAGQVVSPQATPACIENKNDVSRENSTVDFSKVSVHWWWRELPGCQTDI